MSNNPCRCTPVKLLPVTLFVAVSASLLLRLLLHNDIGLLGRLSTISGGLSDSEERRSARLEVPLRMVGVGDEEAAGGWLWFSVSRLLLFIAALLLLLLF